ncbi:MAG: metal-sulfur cluster assembly factor [Planctomycetaceae bacterium]|nr:metal-sulfur cluster assembly factor [Planctomycetaceae bacterium]
MNHTDRTDSVENKLRLLQAAYARGEHDLAMSLADSVKDSLAFARQQTGEGAAQTTLPSVPVSDLPAPWQSWAEGWTHCRPVTLFETIGVARNSEPVDLPVSESVHDPFREIRIARIDGRTGDLHEVRSQVYDDIGQGRPHRRRVVFQADVPLHGRADYLIFSDNPNAELPAYTSDLVTHGERYGLDIENAHYFARLSRQMGQLERLTYKREHGLELYAGGKGHGEPPMIDWGHDYVDPGHFQKLRMRNWPECRNFDVVKGPLFVRVRRWGFPYSPVHPIFTPSRMHIDQTYTFHAGLPYFFKEGRMDTIQDHRIEAMRDDEWVFSGYSFTQMLWIDSQGKLHEGAVPPEHGQDIWGVGFYHQESRDAFMALRLDHSAENFDDIKHDGVPTLHYFGHGQLWSRYPAQQTELKAGTSIRQKNAYLVSPYAVDGAARDIETLRHQLQHPLEVRFDGLAHVSKARATGRLARDGETPASSPLKADIWKTLNEVKDEQLYNLDAGIVDLGYVYDVRVRAGVVTVVLTMPLRGRPVYEFLVTQGGGRVEPGVRERLLKLKGVRDVVVEFTWEPAWTVTRLNAAGRRALGLPVPERSA